MRKLTVSVDDFTAAYLEGTGNASAWIRHAARAAALAEASRCYGEFEQAAGLVAPEYHHALLRLHSAQARGDGTVNLAPEMINSDLATAASGGISLV